MSVPALGDGVDGFLAALAASNEKAATMDLAERRVAARELRLPWNAGGPEMARIENVTLPGGVPARRYTPTDTRSNAPTLVYFHGGGWVMLDIDTHDRLVRELADAAGMRALSLDWPLSPESVFPATVEACVAAVRGLRGTEGAVRGIVLGGDSAGANVAMAVALALRDAPEDGLRVAGLLLSYGVYDSGLAQDSYDLFCKEPFQLTREKMAIFWEIYCPDAAARRSALAAPLHADLSGLPPTRLIVADLDVLRDENLEVAHGLEAAGVAVSIERHPDMPHGFMEAVAFIPAARRAVWSAAEWIGTLDGEMRRT